MTEELKTGLKKKGGALFPSIDLEAALGYARKLVSKTHGAAQPASTILPGVFGASSWRGATRAAALRQYNLLEGLSEALSATPLAKKIVAAPDDERPALLQEVFLSPKVFLNLYETYRGDEVSLAKLKQQSINGNSVHPDKADECVNAFAQSAVFSGAGILKGDVLVLRSADPKAQTTVDLRERPEDEPGSESAAKPAILDSRSQSDEPALADERPPSGRAVIHVNVNLDSSLDTEKLEKQLQLLRRFGAL